MNHAAMLLTLFSIACVSSLTTAQTVSTRAPVVVQAQYVSSSSPMSDGRVVRTVFDSEANRNVTTASEPYRVSQGAAFQAAPTSTSWQTLSPPYVDAVAVPSQSNYPVTAAPPSISRLPVSSSTVPATTVYYPQAGQANAYYVPLGSPTTVYSGSPECACEAAQPPVIQSPALPFRGSPAVAAIYPQNTIYKPVLPLRRTINGAYVSQGIWGQPKAYVPSEPVRNFFRYLLP